MQNPGNGKTQGTSPPPGRRAWESWVAWARGHVPLVTVLAVVVVALVVLAVVSFGGSGNQPSGNSARPAASAPPDVQAATTVTKGSTWLNGAGARQLDTVSADLGKVMAAEQAGSGGAAAKAAGARLAADAAAALNGPMPPVDAAAYRSALKDLEAAGSAAADGQFGGKASGLLAAGQAGLMKVTAAADAPVPLKTPAVPEPAGQ